MLKRCALLGAVLMAAASCGAQGNSAVDSSVTSEAPVMSLDDAVTYALGHNELVAQSQQATRKARAKVIETGASGLPQVKVTAAALRQKEVSAQFGAMSFTITPDTSKASSATATQLLDVWGSVKRARSIASLGSQIAELNALRAKSEVIYQTRAAYYNVLRAVGGVEAAQAAVKDAEEQLTLAEQYVAAGTSPQFDVTRAKVTLAERQQVLIASKDGISLAGAAFNNTLGRDVNTPVNLAPLTERPSREADISAQTQKALESRPEVIQSQLGVRANYDALGISKAGNRPQVALTGTYAYSWTTSGLSSEKANWNYGVSMAWPLFDSGATRAKVTEARADLQISELQVEQLKRGVALDVRQTGLKVQETADSFEVADKAVGMAEEALRLARVRYQNGVATQVEVTDAETALTSARFNRNNALFDHMTARAAFDASVMGRQ